jgi:riboflavin synthase
MFTGLIEKTTLVNGIQPRPGGVEISLAKPQQWNDLQHGESIAVDGACLTLASQTETELRFFVSKETLDRTILGSVKPGSLVNLERSLQYGSRIGGHLVQGHVDGVARVTKKETHGETVYMEISLPQDKMNWVVPKGSITINGVSLTVNDIDRAQGTVSLMLIPETLKLTNLESLDQGGLVNIEYDQMVKIIAEQFKITRTGYELHT